MQQSLSKFLVILFWCCGIIFGICAANAANTALLSLMHCVSSAPVSIVGILLPDLFLLLLTAYAFVFARPWLFCAAAFLKSFSLGYFFQGMQLLCGQGTWLAMLFRFPGVVTSSWLLWFCIHHISKECPSAKRQWLSGLLLHVLAAFLEYGLSMRFLAL